MSGKLVGIDLGTTFSAIATLDDRGQPVTLPNRDGDMLLPSAVYLDEDGHVKIERGVVRRDDAPVVKGNGVRSGDTRVTPALPTKAKALHGEKLPKVVDTGFYYYDKSNIDDPKIAAVLYK